jgi:biotin carboxylase
VTTVLLVGDAVGERVAARAAELGVSFVRAAADETAIAEAARRTGASGLLTFDERSVSTVAAAADDLELPGVGREVADVTAHKIALRRRLAEHGVPQPEFAAVRTLQEARRALETIGLPAVLKPASPSPGRAHFLIQYDDELETHLHVALAQSPTREAIVERYERGPELTAVAVVSGGEVRLVAVSDRRRAQDGVLGAASAELFPTTLFGDALALVEDTVRRAVHVVGLNDGIARVRLALSEDGPRLIGLVPCLDDAGLQRLALHGLGVDLVEIALRQALGRAVEDLVATRPQAPVAVRYLTAEPGPLPAGTVRRVGTLDKVAAFPGVIEAVVDLAVGATIEPVSRNGAGHGYVVATGETNLEAAERAEAAARLVDVEVW